MNDPGFPLPTRDELSSPFWDALQRGQLLFQRCRTCDHAWLPASRECPRCLSAGWTREAAGGEATLVSWVVFHHAFHPAFADRLPYTVAVVRLAEGPRLISNLVDVGDPEALTIDAALRLRIGDAFGVAVPQFTLADGKSGEHAQGNPTGRQPERTVMELGRRGVIGTASLLGTLAAGPIAAARADEPGRAPPQPEVTEPLGAFIATSRTASWPEDVLDLGRRHILDTLAAIVACRDLRIARLARTFALAQSGAGGGGSSLLGTTDRAALADAVFANAMTGCAAEVNDYSPSAFVQPGPSVVSVALGVAQSRRGTGHDVLRAVIAGYEVGCRMPKALGNRNLARIGLANHGVGSLFGSAAAAASVMGLAQDRIPDLLSYCSELASGSWQWPLDSEHMEKAFVFAGMGARNGLLAAVLVDTGFTGVKDNLDRAGGWMASGAFTGPDSDMDRGYLVERLGSRFELPLVGYKRYPAGGPTQAGVEGTLRLAGQVDREQVAKVVIEMPGPQLDAFTGGQTMAALNLPYMVAVILETGRLDFDAVQGRGSMDDPAVRKRMAAVVMVSDPGQVRTPRVESARVTFTMADSSRHETFVEHVSGFPDNPMSQAEVEDKAIGLMSPRLGASRARAVADLAGRIDAIQDIDELIAALTPG